MDDIDLTEVLTAIVKSSIEDFLFPKCSLEYAEDTSRDPLDSEEYGCSSCCILTAGRMAKSLKL